MTTTSLVAPISLATDLLTGAEWSPGHTRDLLQLSADIKARPGRYASTLTGKFIALIFEKPSLRTRVTFDVGIQSMGGSVVFLDHTQASASLGARESIADVARNLDRWVHGIVARVYKQRVLEEMAASANIPVINALSDKFHPCQALADFFTLEEKFGSLRGFKLTYVGDGNNVCHSLIYLAARLGVHLRIATPPDYQPLPEVVADSKRVARETRAKIELMTDPREAVVGAQGVYTDAWTSMGFEVRGKYSQGRVRAVSGQLRADGSRRARRRLHALSSGAPRPRSHARSSRWPAVGRSRPIRKPHVRAESHPAYFILMRRC